MKNKFKFFGVIALIAVIGFSMATCTKKADDPNKADDVEMTVDEGGLTISGLDEYNGKYIYAAGYSSEDGYIYAFPSDYALAKINNGTVTTKVWKDDQRLSIYSGNSTVEFRIRIINENSNIDMRDADEMAIAWGTTTVTFENGVAKGIFKKGEEETKKQSRQDIPGYQYWFDSWGDDISKFAGGKGDILVTSGVDGRLAYLRNGDADWITVTNTPFPQRDGYIISYLVLGGTTFVAQGLQSVQKSRTDPRDFIVGYSKDGINWNKANTSITDEDAYCSGIAYGNGRFVMIGGITLGVSAEGITNVKIFVKVSTDGVKWTDGVPPLDVVMSNIDFDGDEFIISGFREEQPTAVSTDGLEWTVK